MQMTHVQIKQELFYRGELRFLLYKHQRVIYDKIKEVLKSDSIEDNSYVLNISRQFGKSFTLFLIAVEHCIKNPYSTIVYVAPLKKQVVEIVTENTFRVIFRWAPKELIPIFRDSELYFSNGSRIRLAGTDGKNYSNLRGGVAHLVLLDEAGFMSDLNTGVIPTVQPMTKTTGGKILFASTPPEQLDHDFYDVLRDHDESGNISTYTIEDDETLTEKQFNTIVSACKGKESTLFKREYMCQRIAESSMQVFPELGNDLPLIENYRDTFFKYYRKYIIVDFGGRDITAVIFAHYNYRTKTVIIEDQLSLVGNEVSAGRIAQQIIQKRDELWAESDLTTPISYFCDSNNIIVQNDMIINHNLPFVSTTKGRLVDQMVSAVRDWLYDGRIQFAIKAEETYKCCKSAHWSKDKSAFARSKIYGHYDLAASLVYLIRNIDLSDPIPAQTQIKPDQYVDANFGKANHTGLAKIFRSL